MKITRIDCIRGGQLFPITLKNGDRLDSVIELYSGDRRVYKNEYVNTDPSDDWKTGGILKDLTCRFLCDRRADNNKKVLYLYQADADRDKNIVLAHDLTIKDRTLESLIMNPAHGMKYIMDAILIHAISRNSDGSRGCISMDEFNKFISYFFIGDKGTFNLRTAPGWQPPDKYRGIKL